MFGIGMPELILILAVALIVIGPKKLPDLARSMGRALGEFKKAANELKSSMGVDEELNDVKNAFGKMNTEVRAIKDSVNENPLKTSKEKSSAENSPPDHEDQKRWGDDKTAAEPGGDPLENFSNLDKTFDQLNEETQSADADPNTATPPANDPPVHG